ncbi:TPA: hypothetical protein JI107_18130 [Acinetobacter baumannii]|nr:hypothetical protein [Acinetobacter baumannii]
MRMKFIAYDPDTRQKLKLIEHSYNDRVTGTKFYYSDERNNFVYNLFEKELFELGHYNSTMRVMIANKVYYLIGEC